MTTFNYEELQILIATNLTKLRKASNMSVRELGVRAGISYTVIYDMENRHILPKVETLVKICNVFNITFQELIGSTFKSKEPMSLEEYLFSYGLPKKKIEMAESYINYLKFCKHKHLTK